MTRIQPIGFDFAARQRKLLAVLEEMRLDALLVTNLLNIAYLTGFRGSAGSALFGRSGGILWVDPRYTLQAGQDAHGVAVREVRGSLLVAAGTWMAKQHFGKVGVDDENLSVRQFEVLKERVRGKVRLRPAGRIVEELRAIKDKLEVERIRAAGKVTVGALNDVLSQVKPGARESDLAAEIEYCMRRRGAEGAAFESIVASGARSALPHARPSRKLLEKFDLVIIDVGAIVDGYVADMTRTIFLGKPDNRVRRLYGAVLNAQEQGIEALADGVFAGQADTAARRALKRHRLDKYFTHSTGHGLGMEVHEAPRLGRNDKSKLAAGSVVTVEPGVYLDGFGGVRIEDTILVGPDGPEILTLSTKTDWIRD